MDSSSADTAPLFNSILNFDLRKINFSVREISMKLEFESLSWCAWWTFFRFLERGFNEESYNCSAAKSSTVDYSFVYNNPCNFGSVEIVNAYLF